MNFIEKINDEPIQTHTLEFSRGVIDLKLRFLPVVQIWMMDVTYTKADNDQPEPTIYSVKLALANTHVRHRNWPFDFAVIDTSGEGIDPFRIDDFSNGRCEMYFVTPEEMIELRGADVQ